MKTTDILKYGSITVGAVSATILVLNYMNEKDHKKMQKELLALQLEEYKTRKQNGFSNFSGTVDITATLPTKSSGTPDWCLFYDTLKKRYGKDTADLIFVKAWEKRRGTSVDVIAVKQCTGIALDTTWKEQLLDKANRLADTGFNTFESNFKFIGTTPKVLFWGGIGLAAVIVGVVAYKAITTKPNQQQLGEG